MVFEILTSFLYVLLTIFALVFFSFSSSFFLFFPRQAKKMGNTFQGATAMSSCNKRRILRGWAGNADFNGIGDNNGFSANDACPAFSDVTFKEASWGMCLPDTPLHAVVFFSALHALRITVWYSRVRIMVSIVLV